MNAQTYASLADCWCSLQYTTLREALGEETDYVRGALVARKLQLQLTDNAGRIVVQG